MPRAAFGRPLLLLAAVAVSYLPLFTKPGRERARYAGWRGNGAAVCLLVAWFSSLVLTSLLVLGAHAWLSAATPQTSTRAHRFILRRNTGTAKSKPLWLIKLVEKLQFFGKQ